jgi:hypothetical protein
LPFVGILISIAGYPNIYAAPEYSGPFGGQDPNPWLHVLAHLTIGIVAPILLSWGVAALVLLMTKRVAPARRRLLEASPDGSRASTLKRQECTSPTWTLSWITSGVASIEISRSCGSALGLLYAQAHPDRLCAFIGVSQVVSTREGRDAQYDFSCERR